MFSEGLAELVLVVSGVERSARSHGEVVGLTPERPAEHGWAWFWAGEPGHAQRLALRNGPLLVEEHSPLPEGGRWGRVHGPTRFDWMRAASYYFHDPDGNLLEFRSPDAGSAAKETH